MKRQQTYEAGQPRPSASQLMVDGAAAEIRGLVDGMTVNDYQDRLTEVIRVATWARGPDRLTEVLRVATWARGPVETFDSIDDMLADLEKEDDDGPGL